LLPRGTTLIALLSRASLFTSGRMPNAAPVTEGTGTAYYPFEVQRAAQGRFSFFSPAASHHPAALWKREPNYSSLSTHLSGWL